MMKLSSNCNETYFRSFSMYVNIEIHIYFVNIGWKLFEIQHISILNAFSVFSTIPVILG